MDIEFVGQLIDSMKEGVEKLEEAVAAKNVAYVNNLRVFVFDLHNKISDAIGGKDV